MPSVSFRPRHPRHLHCVQNVKTSPARKELNSSQFCTIYVASSNLDAYIQFNTAVKGGKGPATSLFVDQIAKPSATAGQAIVKIHAFGLNRMDLLQREGRYPVPPQAPETIGVEFSGVVESLSAETTDDFKVGDEVFGLAYGGMFFLFFLRICLLEGPLY